MIHWLSNTRAKAWFVPLVYATAAITLGVTSARLAHFLLPSFVSTISASAAIGIYSAIASGMIALTGIVFSLTFIMVQFSATAYSPRLVLWIARDPVVSHAIGVFTATFLYALVALAWVDRSGSGRVSLLDVCTATTLLLVSVIMFISLIQRLSRLQVTQMLLFTGDRGREIIENLYPPLETPASPISDEIFHAPSSQTLVHHGRPQVVQAVNVAVLLHIARKAE